MNILMDVFSDSMFSYTVGIWSIQSPGPSFPGSVGNGFHLMAWASRQTICWPLQQVLCHYFPSTSYRQDKLLVYTFVAELVSRFLFP